MIQFISQWVSKSSRNQVSAISNALYKSAITVEQSLNKYADKVFTALNTQWSTLGNVSIGFEDAWTNTHFVVQKLPLTTLLSIGKSILARVSTSSIENGGLGKNVFTKL